MMYVEIDNGHTLQLMRVDGMVGTDGDVIENAETHRFIAFGMMTGGTHGTECLCRRALHYQVDTQDGGTGGMQGCLQGKRVHCGIAIQPDQALFRCRIEDRVDIIFIVRS